MVSIDGGKRKAFLKEDNSFAFQGLSPGIYLVEVEVFMYEQVRVDINSKGENRARKNNPVQPNQVTQLPYPFKAKPLGKFKFRCFEKREECKITDVLFNPMVMMMVMTLLLKQRRKWMRCKQR